VTASAVVGGGVEWRRRTGKLTNRDLATSFGLLPTTSALLRSWIPEQLCLRQTFTLMLASSMETTFQI
jgi:hypothetical protein